MTANDVAFRIPKSMQMLLKERGKKRERANEWRREEDGVGEISNGNLGKTIAYIRGLIIKTEALI